MSASAAPSGPRRNSSGLGRDLDLLDALASAESLRSGGLGVSQVAQIVGRDKASISRALATLADGGLVERDDDTLRYSLGPRLYALAAGTAQAALTRASRAHLRKLTQVTRETSHLCVLQGGNVLTLISELSPLEIRTTGWAGSTTAAWRTPSGRVLLSDWDEASLTIWYEAHGQDRALVGPFSPEAGPFAFPVLNEPAPGTSPITDFDSLLTELKTIRERGYATSDQELESGVVAASSPVVDFTGRIVAAVNVSAPKARIGDRLDALGAYTAKAARELSRQLGSPRHA